MARTIIKAPPGFKIVGHNKLVKLKPKKSAEKPAAEKVEAVKKAVKKE